MGGKFGSSTEGANEVRWKGYEVYITKGGTHSEHLCDEAHELTLRVSLESQQFPAISTSIHVDESGYRISF